MTDVSVKEEPSSDFEQEEDSLLVSDTNGDSSLTPKAALFTCSECSQSFKTKSSLHYHQRKYRHCGMEPFACELCGKEFGIATHLTSHTRTHTKQKPFFCPLEDCDRVYSRIDLVNVHLIKCHKINYKVKSKCFRDGVFCGQVFINGEMRLIQKVIPDKAAMDGLESDTPQGLTAKVTESMSQGNSFDIVDGPAPKQRAPDDHISSQVGKEQNQMSPFKLSQFLVTSHATSQPSVLMTSVPNTPQQHHLYHYSGVGANLPVKNGVDARFRTQNTTANMNNNVKGNREGNMLPLPNFMNPMPNCGEVRFSNTNGGTFTTAGNLAASNGKNVVNIPASSPGVLSRNVYDYSKSGHMFVPSANALLGTTNSNAVKVNERSSPLHAVEFPNVEQPKLKKRRKKKCKSTPIRPPIEIPKLRVKVCIIPNESRYKCPDCDYVTDTMPMAILHMRESQHGGMKRKSYRCQLCSKRYLLKETLCQHMKKCTGKPVHSTIAQQKPTQIPTNPVNENVKNYPAKTIQEGVPQLGPLQTNNPTLPIDNSRMYPVKTETLETDNRSSNEKLMINFTTYPSLATFGDISGEVDQSKNGGEEDASRPKKKRKKQPTPSQDVAMIKQEENGAVTDPNVAVSTAQQSVKKQQNTDLPGIETFFSSSLSTPSLFGMQNPPSSSPFQSFFGGVPNIMPQKIEEKSMDRVPTPDAAEKNTLSAVFPWLNIKSVLQSYQDDLSTNLRCSESEVADILSASADGLGQDSSRTQQMCMQCKASFKTLSLLRYHQHKNYHDGYEPYQCPHCEANFGSKGHLDTHLRKHTKEKPYYCPLCHRTFSRVDLVNSHLRSQHKMPVHISGKDVLLPKSMWSPSEDENMISFR